MTEAPKSGQPLAKFYRETFLNCMNAEEVNEPIPDELKTLLSEMNAFLSHYNQPPIPEDALLHAPDDVAIKLRNAFDNQSLNDHENPLNSGEGLLERLDSHIWNKHMSELMNAFTRYYEASNIPMRNGRIEIMIPQEQDMHMPKIFKWQTKVKQNEKGEEHHSSSFEVCDNINFEDDQNSPKKRILCVGGASCFNDNPRQLERWMKSIERILGGPSIYDEHVELYCISHPTDFQSSFSARSYALNADPENAVSEQARNFVDKVIKPFLFPNNEEKPDIDKLKSRFRELNFCSTSYGGAFVREVSNYLGQLMEERGYDSETSKAVLAEAYSLSIMSSCRIDSKPERGNFSGVFVMSMNDTIIRGRVNTEKFLKDKDPQKPAIVPLNDNELLVWADIPSYGFFFDPMYEGADPNTNPGDFTLREPTGHGFRNAMARTLPGTKRGTETLLGRATHDPHIIGKAFREAIFAVGRPPNVPIASTIKEDDYLHRIKHNSSAGVSL